MAERNAGLEARDFHMKRACRSNMEIDAAQVLGHRESIRRGFRAF
jgi:hypothetical protein